MEIVLQLVVICWVASGLMMIAGLISPVTVLWWMDYQNRLRVLRLYGSIFLFLTLMWLILRA